MAKITAETLVEKEVKKRGLDGAVEFFSRTFEIKHDMTYLSACANILTHYYDEPEKFVGLYWSIRSQLFALSGQLDQKAHNKLLYGKLARHFFRFSKKVGENIICDHKVSDSDNVDRIVILIAQYLKPPHSPTMAAAEFAKRFIDHNGAEVLIVDASELPLKKRSTFHPPFWGNRTNETGYSTSEFDGSTLDLYTATSDVISVEKAQQIIDEISKFGPDAILTIGDSMVSAEILSQYWPVVCWPSTQTEPISSAPTQFYRSIEPHKMEIEWKKLKLAPPTLIKQDFDTQNNIPNLHSVDREQLRLPEDAFVFILVGARIKQELSTEFQQLMIRVLEHDPKVHMLILGAEKFEILNELHAHKDRLRLVQFATDLRGVISLCDAFLNPPRQGGGGGGYLAMLESLPILTLDDCDVQMGILNDAAVSDLAELEQLAKDVVTNETIRNEYIEKSKKRVSDFMTPEESSTILLSHLKTAKIDFLENQK